MLSAVLHVFQSATASTRSDLSLFNNLADMGLFITLALILIAAGGILVALSWLLPGEPDNLS